MRRRFATSRSTDAPRGDQAAAHGHRLVVDVDRGARAQPAAAAGWRRCRGGDPAPAADAAGPSGDLLLRARARRAGRVRGPLAGERLWRRDRIAPLSAAALPAVAVV